MPVPVVDLRLLLLTLSRQIVDQSTQRPDRSIRHTYYTLLVSIVYGSSSFDLLPHQCHKKKLAASIVAHLRCADPWTQRAINLLDVKRWSPGRQNMPRVPDPSTPGTHAAAFVLFCFGIAHQHPREAEMHGSSRADASNLIPRSLLPLERGHSNCAMHSQAAIAYGLRRTKTLYVLG